MYQGYEEDLAILEGYTPDVISTKLTRPYRYYYTKEKKTNEPSLILIKSRSFLGTGSCHEVRIGKTVHSLRLTGGSFMESSLVAEKSSKYTIFLDESNEQVDPSVVEACVNSIESLKESIANGSVQRFNFNEGVTIQNAALSSIAILHSKRNKLSIQEKKELLVHLQGQRRGANLAVMGYFFYFGDVLTQYLVGQKYDSCWLPMLSPDERTLKWYCKDQDYLDCRKIRCVDNETITEKQAVTNERYVVYVRRENSQRDYETPKAMVFECEDDANTFIFENEHEVVHYRDKDGNLTTKPEKIESN